MRRVTVPRWARRLPLSALLLGLLAWPGSPAWALSQRNAERLALLQAATQPQLISGLTAELLAQIEGSPTVAGVSERLVDREEQAEILRALLRSRNNQVRSRAADAYMDAPLDVQRLVYPTADTEVAGALLPSEAATAGLIPAPPPGVPAIDGAGGPPVRFPLQAPRFSNEPMPAISSTVPETASPVRRRSSMPGDQILASLHAGASGGPVEGEAEPGFRTGPQQPEFPLTRNPPSCPVRVSQYLQRWNPSAN